MSLYIGGAQFKMTKWKYQAPIPGFKKIYNDNDCRSRIINIASRFDLFIDNCQPIENDDYFDMAFIISNSEIENFVNIQDGEMFDAKEIEFPVSETFNERFQALLAELQNNEEFKFLCDLPWSEEKRSYFVIS